MSIYYIGWVKHGNSEVDAKSRKEAREQAIDLESEIEESDWEIEEVLGEDE